MSITIRVRDANLRRQVEVDDYSSLDVTLVYRGVGAWELKVAGDSDAANALTFRGGLVVTDDETGETIVSGPVSKLSRAEAEDGSSVLTATGSDDTALLARRLVRPGSPPYTTVEYDTVTGPAETVLRHYVAVNAGPAAVASRQVAGLALEADLGRGLPVIGKGRWDNLLELLQTYAATGGVGFRVAQVGSQLVFSVDVPRDLTRVARFSRDLGNLPAYTYETVAPTGNYAYGGGGGAGTARLIVETSDAPSVSAYDLFETFVDQQDELDSAVLAQGNRAALVEQSASSTLALSPIDTPDLAYGRDYRLGDRVTVELGDSAPLEDVLRQVRLVYSSEGPPTVTPTMASDGASMTGINLFDTIRRTARSVATLGKR